jgi:outer membrane receptor for ferrienterochelin and colicins
MSGRYRLLVSRMGYLSERREIVVGDTPTAPLRIVLDERTISSPGIVVTATRSERDGARSPIPTTVIANDEIRQRSSRRLGDLLSEQTGLAMIHDHGSGVQVQGLDADYTLVLIDGNPIIGRTAGTLDLMRIPVADVERVEIVKGPSSSLYGSEALAGVVNVITRRPDTSVHYTAQVEYGAHERIDLSVGAQRSIGPVRCGLFIDRLGSAGYDLDPTTITPTVAPFTDYTIAPELELPLSSHVDLRLTSRLSTSAQNSPVDMLVNGDTVTMDDHETRHDWNLALTGTWRANGDLRLTGKLYGMRYTTSSTIGSSSIDEYRDYYRSDFDQLYGSAEAQADWTASADHYLTFGGGYTFEGVEAERIEGGDRTMGNGFAFVQDQWSPHRNVEVLLGARFDAPTEYTSKLAPKAAVLVKPYDWLSLRGSVGSGFKGPTFQQLYLDFTNPSVGYSVFGATELTGSLAELERQGIIERRLAIPGDGGPIRPESSTALNAGMELRPWESLRLSGNLFYNHITDLIETSPVAVKTNGQYVYSYFNINKVVTRGIESEMNTTVVPGFRLTVGYQYLESYDVTTLDRVREGDIVKTGSTGRVRPVQESEYGGLFSRSRHSGTIGISYSDPSAATTASLRVILRGRYGFADLNGNSILDDASEYHEGYALWNLVVTRRIVDGIEARIGADNFFDFIDPDLPELSGRRIFVGLSARVSARDDE